jgi:hypothetical protein
MKNLQTRLLKFLLFAPLFFLFISSDAQSLKIRQADSLFRIKHYTQSLDLYQAAFNNKEYTPAMLLKMAYIQEGLGKIGQTLYSLKLYYLATDDEQALAKTEELATKFKLSGYNVTDAGIWPWIKKNKMKLQLALTGVVLLAAIAFFFQRRQNQRPWLAASVLTVTSCAILYLNNVHFHSSVIVVNDRTYLMDGPSAGAHVSTILGEGNQLESLGEHDVWLKVKWMEKEVYVKKKSVVTVSL